MLQTCRSHRRSCRGFFVLLPCLLIVSSGVGFYDIPDVYEQKDQREDSMPIVSPWILQKRKLLQGKYLVEGINCSSVDLDSFPNDVFTQKQRRNGAIILHFVVALYLFAAITIVVDDYFVASLESLSDCLHLSGDVAGATLMAAASSSPELFAAILGTFCTKGDIGVGTIVGSGVFNILVLVGGCCLVAKDETSVTSWPLIRDNVFYLFSIGVLLVVLIGGEVTWYKSLCLVMLYGVYIIIMKFNGTLQGYYGRLLKCYETCCCSSMRQKPPCHQDGKTDVSKDQLARGNEENVAFLHASMRSAVSTKSFEASLMDRPQRCPLDQRSYGSFASSGVSSDRRKNSRLGFRDVVWRVMLSSKFPRTRFRAACRIVIDQMDHETRHPILASQIVPSDADLSQKISESENGQQELEEVDDLSPPWHRPEKTKSSLQNFWLILKWLVLFPISFLYYFTIPNCKKQRWRQWFLVTFIISIAWIGVLCWLLVWMVSVIGYTFHIRSSVMGITFLAAGTSLPDIMSSLLVTKKGFGDMAVANAVGSNTFDVLVGLGVPWLVKTAIVDPGGKVTIHSGGLKYTVGMLFVISGIMVVSFRVNKWKLSKRLGYWFLFLYVIVLTISLLVEFNIIGHSNLPLCPTH